ncbi:hypothetical protein [Polaromonas sp. LjRoot131]|uniref:hypothetical protein n=1 Tax=Polaromonas sp. LjRoot131 TaxID=3342262 RepID=UPI003ECED906
MVVRLKKGEFTGAEKLLRRALALRESAVLFASLGKALKELRRPDAARRREPAGPRHLWGHRCCSSGPAPWALPAGRRGRAGVDLKSERSAHVQNRW